MRNKRGIIAKTIKDYFMEKPIFESGIASKVSMKVFAEEVKGDGGAEGSQTEPTKSTINYEDLISKARKEEKEKQYSKIKKLEDKVELFTKQHNDDLLMIGTLEKKVKEAEEKLTSASGGDNEQIATLKTEVQTLKGEKTNLEKQLADVKKELETLKNSSVDEEVVEKRVREELEEEYKVKTYKAEKMAELKDEILVPELVLGTTIEEIDASIETARERSKSIREQLGITAGGSTKKKKGTPKSPTNPSVSGIQDTEYSYEYLASLDPGSKEYAEVRKQLGLK